MKKIEYDPEVKILKIRFRQGKSVDSDIIGNLVLDYDKNGELVKVDVMEINLEDIIGITSNNKKKAASQKRQVA